MINICVKTSRRAHGEWTVEPVALYAYDPAGRLVREGNTTDTYGYLDKVLSVTDNDTTRTFTYHADGQLASATVGGEHRAPRDRVGPPGGRPLPCETETFLWDGFALIQRGDEQFVNEPHIGGGNPVASSKGTSYFNDALGYLTVRGYVAPKGMESE